MSETKGGSKEGSEIGWGGGWSGSGGRSTRRRKGTGIGGGGRRCGDGRRDFGEIGSSGFLIFIVEPAGASAASVVCVWMPFVVAVMGWTITKIPGLALPGFGIA